MWMDDIGVAPARGLNPGGLVVLAWAHEPVVNVDLGAPADHFSETLYLISAPLAMSGPVTFSGALIEQGSIETDAMDAWMELDSANLMGGTMTVEYRAVGIDGTFTPRALKIRLTDGGTQLPAGRGEPLAPLPPDEQPDPDNPLATGGNQGERFGGMPRVQLFDLVAGHFVEMEQVQAYRTYAVESPERYIDAGGRFRVRFVAGNDEYAYWSFAAQIEGDAE
jgi:hypothetical protein